MLFESTKLSYTDDFFKVEINSNTKKIKQGEIIEVKVVQSDKNFLKAVI